MGHAPKHEKFGPADLYARHHRNKRKRWVAEVHLDGEELWSQPGFYSSTNALEAARKWARDNVEFKPRSAA